MQKLAKSNRKIPMRKNIRGKIILKSNAFLVINRETLGLVILSHSVKDLSFFYKTQSTRDYWRELLYVHCK